MVLSVSNASVNTIIDVVDADTKRRAKIRALFEPLGFNVRTYATAKAYLRDPAPNAKGCMICNLELPDMTGIELLDELQAKGRLIPTMIFASRGNVPAAVSAIRAGAVDVIENPQVDQGLVQRVHRALKRDACASESSSKEQSK